MHKRRFLVLGMGILLLALGYWFLELRGKGGKAGPDPLGPAAQSPRETAPLPTDKGTARTKKPTQPAPQRTKHVASGASLSFRVVNPKGQPLPGKIYWAFSRTAPRTSRLMAPEFGFALSPGVEKRSHLGQGVLSVPEGRWTWLRVTGVEKKTIRSRYALVPPFEGKKELELRLDPEKRRIHVFLLQKDLVTPASRQEVRLYRKEGGKVNLVQTQKTDSHGYLVFEEDKPGYFLVLAPGANLRDKAPYLGAVVMTPSVPIHKLAITLLVPEPRVKVDFLVHVGLPPSQGLPPKLFLKRMDGELGTLFPMPGILGKGKNRFSLEVPRGTYELSALPLGRIRIPKQNQILRIQKEGQKVELSLFAEGKKVPVTLKGLGYRDFPVSVYPRAARPLLDDELKMMFCGPYRWRIPKNLAAFPRGVFDVLAFGRFGTWISKRKHSSKEASMVVQLEPATLMDFVWRGELPRGSAMMRVRNERGVFFRVLSKRLVPEGGGMFRALVGRLVLPRGRVQLDLMEGDKVLWSRTFHATKKTMKLVGGVKES